MRACSLAQVDWDALVRWVSSSREEAPNDVDLLLAELESRENDVFEDFFEAVFSFGGTFDVTVCPDSFGHSFSFLRGDFSFVAVSHVDLCTYKDDRPSAFGVSFDLWNPRVTDTGKWVSFDHWETKYKNFAFLIRICPQLLKVTL